MFFNGVAYECNVSGRLTIEGDRIHLKHRPGGKLFATDVVINDNGRLRSKQFIGTLQELAERYIAESADLARHKSKSDEHFAALRDARNAAEWRRWRRDHPCVAPCLAACKRFRSTFAGRPLDGYDFSYTNFCQTNLSGLSFKRANFHQAILTKANLTGAHLEGANFCRTDLGEAILRGAHLTGANLQAVQMLNTDLRGAKLNRCKVYGLSAWDLRFDEHTEQQRLVVRYHPRTVRASTARAGRGDREHLDVIVEGLDVAAFMYLTLNNRNIPRIIDAAAKRWVLLLGRFTERKNVLETIAQHVKERQLTPIIFDFPRPKQHDLLETVMLLGGMSRCVIVELTNPRSTPMELQAIASNYGVPIFPIMRRGAREVATLSGLRKFPWVQPTITYRSMNDLIRQLNQSALASSQSRRVLAGR